ncbi:hypothetical protein VTK73DRAFT_5039 [Phialemonium thermophilum]|uniref:tryptophan synthase n=1 Tax=Phialemonium thermophilum TaxID=223376 RepID=A0ABR3V405_9PEZI
MEALKQTFQRCKAQNRPALVTYVTAGFPTVEETPRILLAMEQGGAGGCCASSVFPVRRLTIGFSLLRQT